MSKFYIWISVLLLSDLGTKVWAERSLLPGEKIQVNNLLRLILVHNKGVGFGLFSSNTQFAYALEFFGVIAAALFLFTLHGKQVFLESAITILIISGAAGNLLSRMIFGYVIDFILIKPYPFVFNIADLELRTGLLLFVFLLMKKSLIKDKGKRIKSGKHSII